MKQAVYIWRLPALVLAWMALAAPGFGGGGSSNSSSPGPVVTGRSGDNYDPDASWEKGRYIVSPAVWGVLLAIGAVTYLVLQLRSRQRVIEIIVCVPTADDIVPTLDDLMKSSDSDSLEGAKES